MIGSLVSTGKDYGLPVFFIYKKFFLFKKHNYPIDKQTFAL